MFMAKVVRDGQPQKLLYEEQVHMLVLRSACCDTAQGA